MLASEAHAMRSAIDEEIRLAELYRYEILDTPPELSFDRITRTAATMFDVPIAIITLVDPTRSWFKSCHGLDISEIDRASTMCDAVIRREEVLAIEDAEEAPPDLVRPLLKLGLRFYAGAPLITHDGFKLGTLCVLDQQPRQVTEQQQQTLTDLAATVVDLMEMRLALRKLTEAQDAQAGLAQQLQVLNDLMRIAVSNTGISDLCNRIGEPVSRLVDIDRMCLALRPPADNSLQVHVVSTVGVCITDEPFRLPLESPHGEAILSGRPVLRSNIPEDCVYPIEPSMFADIGLGSLMCVPVKSGGQVLGSIDFGSHQKGRYGARELQMAEQIADHMAIIIDHALLYEHLETANRNKSDFVAGMSHELRTPLNAILGASELMADGLLGTLSDRQQEYVKDIHQSGLHLLSLINDILDLSKIEAGKSDLKRTELSLSALTDDCAAIVRGSAAEKSINFVIAADADVAFMADERRMKQVIYNLLSNAIKFTPDGGKVTLTASAEGPNILLAVADSGPGIPRQFHERIFDQFFQMPGERGGTGLGLSLARQLVELHKGRIWVESESGSGSRFVVSIPS